MLAVLVAVVAAAVYWLPDLGVRYGVLRGLRDLGWKTVSVHDARVSLFNGVVVIHRIDTGPSDAGDSLGLGGLSLDFDWRPLFSRRISVNSLDLTGLSLTVDRADDGAIRVNGLPVVLGGDTAGDDKPSRWSFDITRLGLVDSQVDVSVKGIQARLDIDRLEIRDVQSWNPDIPAQFHLSGRLNGASIQVDGSVLPFALTPTGQVALKITGLDLGGMAALPALAGLDRLTGKITADVTLSLETAGPMAKGRVQWSQAGVTVAGAQIKADDVAVALDRLAWTAKDGVSWAGRLDVNGVESNDGGVLMTAASAHLDMQSGSYDPAKAVLLWTGKLDGGAHRLSAPGMDVSTDRLSWSGVSRWDFSPKSSSFVHAEGKAELNQAKYQADKLVVSAAHVSSQGVFEHARPHGMLPPLVGRMDSELTKVAVSDGPVDWGKADRVVLTGLRLALDSAKLTRMEVTGLGALARRGEDGSTRMRAGGYGWRLEGKRLVLEDTDIRADARAHVKSLALSGAVMRLTRTAKGFLGVPDGADGGKTAPPQASSPVAAEAGKDDALPVVVLDRLSLDGGSTLMFEDRSTSERVTVTIEDIKANLGALDTTKPDRDTPFEAKARIGTAQVTASGQARPLSAAIEGEAKGTVRALDLPPLSPYVADALGVHLQTGQLDADFSLSARRGDLGGGMDLVLSQLFIAAPDPNAPLAKQADMPVETVLDLLRGSDGRIRLTIPVRGNLANPDFDVSDAVNQAVGRALRQAAVTTLKVAFPLVALISMVVDEADNPRLSLDPVAFVPGGKDMPDAALPSLRQISRLLAERPGLSLNVCGVAVEAQDGPALIRLRQEQQGLFGRLQTLLSGKPSGQPEEEDAAAAAAAATPTSQPSRDRLLALAEARAQAVKNFLVEDGKVPPDRLFTCRPRLDADAKAAPRVDLML